MLAVQQGAHIIVGARLVPACGDQGLDNEGILPLLLTARGFGMGMKGFQLPTISLEPILHVAGQRVHVEGAVAIGKNLLGAVVTGDNDKATAVAGIEDIEVGQSRIYSRWLNMGKAQGDTGMTAQPGTVSTDKALCPAPSSCGINAGTRRCEC